MKVLAVGNHKGGTGKSATVHALGEALALAGRRVLLVDADPPATLTLAAGIPDAEGHSLAEVIGGIQPGTLALADILRPIGDRLTLAPSDIVLAVSELGLGQRMGADYVLRQALQDVAGRFDVCLIDCPPTLGRLTVAALTAADAVLVPTQPEAAAIRGVSAFLDSIAQVRRALNQRLELLGVVVTMYDSRLNHHKAAVDGLQAAGVPMMQSMIGRSVRVAEAALAGGSVVTFDPNGPRAAEYKALAEEVIAWLER